MIAYLDLVVDSGKDTGQMKRKGKRMRERLKWMMAGRQKRTMRATRIWECHRVQINDGLEVASDQMEMAGRLE